MSIHVVAIYVVWLPTHLYTACHATSCFLRTTRTNKTSRKKRHAAFSCARHFGKDIFLTPIFATARTACRASARPSAFGAQPARGRRPARRGMASKAVGQPANEDIIALQPMHMEVCAWRETKSARECGRTYAETTMTLRPRKCTHRLDSVGGHCTCGGSIGLRLIPQHTVAVGCERTAERNANGVALLSCRTICKQSLRERAADMFKPSAEEFAKLGLVAAARYKARVDAIGGRGGTMALVPSSRGREAVLFAVRAYSVQQMSDCLWRTVSAIARSCGQARQAVILAEEGCDDAPNLLPRYAQLGVRAPLCVHSARLNVSSTPSWVLFNGKSGASKGGFARWLSGPQGVGFERAWLIEEDMHLGGGNWSALFDGHASSPADLITMSPFGELVQGPVALGPRKAWDCMVEGVPCLAHGQPTLIKSYMQLSRWTRAFAARLSAGLDAQSTRGHHEHVVATQCERMDSCAHATFSRSWVGAFSPGTLSKGGPVFQWGDVEPGKLYHPAKCEVRIHHLVAKDLDVCWFAATPDPSAFCRAPSGAAVSDGSRGHRPPLHLNVTARNRRCTSTIPAHLTGRCYCRGKTSELSKKWSSEVAIGCGHSKNTSCREVCLLSHESNRQATQQGVLPYWTLSYERLRMQTFLLQMTIPRLGGAGQGVAAEDDMEQLGSPIAGLPAQAHSAGVTTGAQQRSLPRPSLVAQQHPQSPARGTATSSHHHHLETAAEVELAAATAHGKNVVQLTQQFTSVLAQLTQLRRQLRHQNASTAQSEEGGDAATGLQVLALRGALKRMRAAMQASIASS